MKVVFITGVLLAALALAPGCGVAADGVARVLGAELTRTELETAGDEPARVARFRDWVWERVFGHYVVDQGLSATAGDISELLAYHREFDRRDRVQRARKLEELNQRLASGALSQDERAHLEEFRKVLARMAVRDAELERQPPADAGQHAKLYAPWIEYWKANRALHEQYGGTIAATNSGPSPQGARVSLISDYERRGLVRFFDPRLREQLFELMSRPPALVVPPERVDFTPVLEAADSAFVFPGLTSGKG